MTDIWDQLVVTESIELKACDAYIAHREQEQLIQFLTVLWSDIKDLDVQFFIVLHFFLLT